MSAAQKKYRKNNQQYRNRQRKSNYDQTKPLVRKRRLWSEHEIFLIVCCSGLTDRELAKNIKRSVQAIQQKRLKLKKMGW